MNYNNAILVGTRIVAHATTSTAMIVIDISNESSVTYATYTGITGGIRSISAHPSGNFVFVPKQTTSAIFYWNVNTTFSSFTQVGGLNSPQLIAFDTVNKTALSGSSATPATIYRTGDDPFTAMVLAMTLGNPTNGSSNGIIALSVVGGYSTKTYLWSNGATTQNLTGLGPGTYSVSVTDSFGIVATLGGGTLVNTTPAAGSATTQNRSSISAGTYAVTVTDSVGTTASASFVVASPASSAPPTASLSSTNPTTYGGTNGSVALTVSEGTSPFTYAWSNGATTQNLSSVGAGTYSVTVTDSSSQTGTASVTLTSPPGASLSPTNPSTFGGTNGSVNLTVSQGTSPFTYSWSNGATTQNVSSLSVGTFSVTVTDAASRTGTASVTLTSPPGASLSLTNPSTFGGTNGSITLTVSQGTSPFTYAWSNGATTQNISSLSVGTYSVTVTDAVSRTGTASVTLTSPPGASLSPTNPSTFGGTNGSVNLTVSQGTSPFTYAWSNGATTQNISSVSAGTYSVTVTDAASRTGTASVTLTSPPGASLSPTNPSTFGGTNGSITLTVSQGTSPYTYSWSNGATTQNISSLSVGTFSITVTDAASRTGTASVTLTSPPGVTGTITHITTNGGSNGAISVSVTQGTTPYAYAWTGSSVTTAARTSLSVGTYVVTVTDALSRTGSSTFVVTNPPVVTAAITNATVYAAADGALDVSVTQGLSPFTYAWTSSSVTTQDRTALAAGSYSVSVTDSVSRTTSASFTVTQPPAMTLVVTPVVLSASWPAVPSSTYYKTTYQATGGTETTNTRDLTTRECLITGLAASTEYTLRVYARDNLVTGLYAEFAPYRRVFTTPAAIAANFDKTVLLTTKTVSPISTAAGSSSATVVTATYDLTALPTSSLTAVADKLASILSTGDTVQIPLSFGEQTKEVKSTIVKLNETVAMPSSSGTYDVPLSSLQAVFMPFTSAGGASQSANLTLGDSSTVTVSFDQTANTVAISGHTYEVGDIFVLGGKKVTIMDVKS